MSSPENDLVVSQAVEWMVLLHSGEMTTHQHDEFLAWRSKDPSHFAAFQAIEGVLVSTSQVSSSPSLRKALVNRKSRRKFLASGITLSVFTPLAGLLLDRQVSLETLLSDFKTETAERATKILSDGSRLTLDARSAADINVDGNYRLLKNLQGRLHLKVEHRNAPFVIECNYCQVLLQEGIVGIESRDEATRYVVLKGRVTIITSNGETKVAEAGKGGVVSKQNLVPETIDVIVESSWVNGVVEVNDKTLHYLVERFRSYTRSYVRLDPKISNMRVSGIFPLDNIDLALETLQQTMPVTVTRVTPYWVTITGKV